MNKEEIRESFAKLISGSAYGLTTAHEKQLMFEAYFAAIESQQKEIDELRHNLSEADRICKEICWSLGHEAESPMFCDMQSEVERLKNLFERYCEPVKAGGTNPVIAPTNKE